MTYREDLDRMGCATPNCTHDHSILYLHGTCHPQAKVTVSYYKATCSLVIRCAQCDYLVAEIRVSSREVEGGKEERSTVPMSSAAIDKFIEDLGTAWERRKKDAIFTEHLNFAQTIAQLTIARELVARRELLAGASE